MPRIYPAKRSDPKTKIDGSKTFSRGLSQIGHPSVIRNDELAEAQNVIYSQNGILEKRPGTVKRGDAETNSTTNFCLAGVYSLNGQDYLLRITDNGTLQRYVFASDIWVNISGAPTFTRKTIILQGYGYVYLLNESDPMTRWDGSTFEQFNAVTNPATGASLSKQGSGTGYTTYYYKIVYYNSVGGTLASPETSLANMPPVLDATTYIRLTLPTAPANATKVGIFRSLTAGDELFLTSFDVGTTIFDDKGGDTDPLYNAPSANTTGGFHFKTAVIFNNTICGTTVELGDHTIVFSAGSDKFDSFALSDGGGYFSWRKDDGDRIVGLHVFQEQLFIFKRNKIGALKFTTEGATIKDINLASGAVSNDSIHPAGNNLRYWGAEGAMSLGNEANFTDVIRTKVLSAKADKTVGSITTSDEADICGVFYKGLSIWGIPRGTNNEGNTSCLVFNERFVAWAEWVGMKPKQFVKFIDSENRERLFFSTHANGEVYEGWEGTSDDGNPIVWRVSTKQFDQGVPYKYKTYSRVYFVFGNVKGGNTRITLIENGYAPFPKLALYASNTGTQGFGVDQWGSIPFGETTGDFGDEVSGINIRYKDLGNKDMFSLQAQFSNDGITDSIQLMGIYIEYADSSQPLPASMELPIDYA